MARSNCGGAVAGGRIREGSATPSYQLARQQRRELLGELRHGGRERWSWRSSARLPDWLFTARPARRRYFDRLDGWQTVQLPARTFAFKLLDRALVVFHNPERAATFGEKGVHPVRYALTYRDGRTVEHEGQVLPSPHASAVRDGMVSRLDVTLQRR